MTQANLFELRNAPISIIFSTSGIDGKPHLTYQKGKTIQNFRGDQIDQQETAIGTMVSVTLKSAPDLHSIVLSVLLPQVNIPNDKSRVVVKTEAIVTTIRTSIAGPKLVNGSVQTYKFTAMKGYAMSVEF